MGAEMQLRDIEYVVAIATHKSFSKAAESLYITQPALSLGIKRLEEKCGFKLFDRKRSETTLTREGEIFLQNAHLIVQLLDQLKSQMKDIQTLRGGKLTIGVTSLFARFYFADTFKLFKTLYPDITILVSENSSTGIEQSLTAGVIDLALMPLPFSAGEFEHEELVSEETFLAVPPTYPSTPSMTENPLEYGTVSLSDFKSAAFILQTQGQRLREIASQACRDAGFTPTIVFETQSVDAANALVAVGIGVSLIPSMIFKTRKNNHGVRYYHIDDVNVSRRIVAAFNDRKSLSPAAQAFINVAKSVLKQH
jgi:LysR family hydrogen peroxide-inducible transcriptional activator